MATLGEVGELVTTQLRDRVDRLVAAVEDESQDFTRIARLSDAVGELADKIAEIYTELEETLMRGVQRDSDSERRDSTGEGNGGAPEDVTKEELLERAREVNVQGRSSMTKEELAQAVEAEEGVTKEELLERARQAEIEGRSSMTKDELRDALRDAGTRAT